MDMSGISRMRPAVSPGSEWQSRPFALALDGDVSDAIPTQAFLDALPVAAALVVLADGVPKVLSRNRSFVRLLNGSARNHLDEIILAVCDHLRDGACTRQFLWTEPMVGGRHYGVQIARVVAHPQFGARVLLTVTDRTSEMETERSLRFEMLHDSLTGLPNRLARDEAIE